MVTHRYRRYNCILSCHAMKHYVIIPRNDRKEDHIADKKE